MTSISRARSASVTAIVPHTGAASLLHGGDLATARRLFPVAPEPFIDLSTGINPHPYPLPQMPPALFARSLFGALQTGEGDQGGRALLSGAALVAADAAELADIDRPGDLPAS